MKIIRINPLASERATEKIMRVLTFENGAYALQFSDEKGQSLLALYDWQGFLIKENVRAESAYIFKNGSYILLYEPTNKTAGSGKVRFRREYRIFTRSGKLVFDEIAFFIPLANDWVVLSQNGVKNLYDDKLNWIDSGKDCDFIRFDGGYARVTAREIPVGKAAPLMPGDAGRQFPYTGRLNTLRGIVPDQTPGVAYDWELFDEKGSHMYSVADGLAVIGGGYMLKRCQDGRIFFHYPDGSLGTETTLYSGARKNIACMVSLTAVRKGSVENCRKTAMAYRMSCETEDGFSLPWQIKDIRNVYEFSNGNFSCTWGENLCFFEEGHIEPVLTMPATENVCFLPDGRYWNIDEKTLCNQTHKVIQERVDAVVDLGDWYIVSQNGSHTVYDSDGNRIAGKVRFVRKVNGILVLRLENGQIGLVHHYGKAVLPPMDEWRCVFEESTF